MEVRLPEIVRRVGTESQTRSVYIEDYVVQYLKMCRKETAEDKEVILFGSVCRGQVCSGRETYIIYGACENGLEGTEYNGFRKEEIIGCINMELWKRAENEYSGIIIGNAEGGQPVEGYYIYYDAEERMKDYLAGTKGETEKEKEIQEPLGFQPKLVALSYENGKDTVSLYTGIRIAVMCIFIILCIIAITTINSYDKMQRFTDAVGYIKFVMGI